MVPTMDEQLPILYFDHPFPEAYRDLIEGRAVAVGPDDADLATADAVLAGAKRSWDAEAFALGGALKVISRIGIGYDNVDVAAATAAGVIVCNAPDAPSVSTAEHTLMLMLATVKNLPAQTERARQGLPGAAVGTALELDGAVLGLVGYGRIARRVGIAATALGMSVLAYDPYINDAEGCRLVGLDEVFAGSDVISLHAPAVAETRHMCRRLIDLFLPDAEGRRPVFGDDAKFQTDPAWNRSLLFYEYFHGDTGEGLGASHQTGWTGLVADLMIRRGHER